MSIAAACSGSVSRASGICFLGTNLQQSPSQKNDPLFSKLWIQIPELSGPPDSYPDFLNLNALEDSPETPLIARFISLYSIPVLLFGRQSENLHGPCNSCQTSTIVCGGIRKGLTTT